MFQMMPKRTVFVPKGLVSGVKLRAVIVARAVRAKFTLSSSVEMTDHRFPSMTLLWTHNVCSLKVTQATAAILVETKGS